MPQVRSSLARASCFPCRRSKRRCDKTLPACQLCRRRGLDCRYPHRRGQTSASPSPPNSTLEDVVTIGSDKTIVPAEVSVDRPQLTLSETSAHTAAVRFLAPYVLPELRLQISSLEQGIPGEVAFHLGDRQQMQDVTIEFLRRTRPWMPVVNGRRHLAAVLNPLLATPRRSRALLTLCMKLCSLQSSDKASGYQVQRSLYLLTKGFHAEVERTEDPCLEIMQATLFIAVFEIGEALYPAAYFTIGALTRYGLVLGLDKINQHKTGAGVGSTTGASWIDIEEMRRVWWGVLIMDRCVMVPCRLPFDACCYCKRPVGLHFCAARLANISHPLRGLSTSDPSYDDYLPVDDERFINAVSYFIARPASAMAVLRLTWI